LSDKESQSEEVEGCFSDGEVDDGKD